jgi:hypothetical protein
VTKRKYPEGWIYSSEHQAWQDMKGRCLNKKHRQYHYYGGRGITIYGPWLKFENFIKDMGWKPQSNLTLERTNNNGNYEPGNCKWATQKEQRSNQRFHKLNPQDVKKIRELYASGISGYEIAKGYNVHVTTIYDAIGNRTWRKDK